MRGIHTNFGENVLNLFLLTMIKYNHPLIFACIIAYTRVGGNKKGIFTRDRQPKMAAHHVRKRYHALEAELGSTQMPEDIESYISSFYFQHSEL